MNKKKNFIIIVIMLAFILVGISCVKPENDDTKDYLVYLLAKDAGYEGTNDEFKELVKDVEIKNINKVYINENGELIVVLNDNSEKNCGIVKENVTISNVELNSLGEMVLTFSNSKIKNLGNVINRSGLDISKGSIIKSISINALGELILFYENGKTFTLGFIFGKGNSTIGIIDIDVNESLEVVVTYNDKTVKNLGKILLSINEEKQYTVRFQSFMNIVFETEVPENSLISLPQIDKVKGYRLLGWYVGTKEWDFSKDVVTSDITLIAKYEEFEDVEPVYQGMSIIGETTNRNRKNKNGQTNMKDAVDDFLDIITTEKIDYYASKGEKLRIVIHLYNPSEYEILSFTLNEKKYQSFEFKEGSDSSQLIIEVDAGMKPGLKEYTIDGIKYIDKTEIKDVRMDGEKTVKAGIKYDVLPNATVVKEEFTTTKYQSIFEIKDENQLINTNTGLYYFLFDGSNIVFNQKLSLGVNSVVYDNLQMGSEYEYMVVGVYDDYSGAGNKAVTLASSKFSALDGFLIEEETASKDEITLKAIRESEQAQIQEVSLYDGEDKVQSIKDINDIRFTNLLSNHNYIVRITYSYVFDNLPRTKTLEREINTLSKEKPSFEINNLVSGKRNVSYEVNYSDIDNVIISKQYNLKLNGEIIKKTSENEFTFTDLFTNNTYDFEVAYTYDLNDGNGIQVITESKQVKTLPYTAPTVGVNINNLTDKVISGNVSVSDVDNVFILTDIKLMQDDNLLNIQDSMNFIFDVDSNVNYVLVIDYSYDLNDGNGLCQEKYEYNVRTKKEVPVISFTPYHITDNLIEYNLLISDNNVSGRLNFIALYEGLNFITKYDEVNTKIEGLKSNTEYTLKINYVYDFDDGYGKRELTSEYLFKTLKQTPTYDLGFANIDGNSFELIHNINDIDGAFVYKGVDVLLNNEIVKTLTAKDNLKINDLYADNNYKIIVKFDRDLNNGLEEINYTGFVKTKAYDRPAVDINLESNKTEVRYKYEINDPYNMAEVKDISIYYLGQKVDKIADLNRFSDLYSNSEYTVRITLLNNYFDGREKREEVYEKKIKTLPLNAPSVDLKFTSKVDSINYNINKNDIDNILKIEKIDVYENDKLIQSITDFNNQTITNLNSNTIYSFLVTYKYNLNDRKDDIQSTIEYKYSTLSYNVNINNISVLNETSPKTNEDVNVKLFLDNKSKVKISYLVVNGEKMMISGGNEIDDAIIIIRAPKMSGLMNINIEKMGYLINGVEVEQEVEGKHNFDVQIFSRLDIIGLSLVNGTKFDKTNTLGYVLTIDNPYGYKIKNIKIGYISTDCTMIDNNHLYIPYINANSFINSEIIINGIYYEDENNNDCVRNYSQRLERNYNSYATDTLTDALLFKQVSTPEEFMNMSRGAIYELVNDIDMQGYNWTPYLFNGYFNGNGHTIKNLTYIHEDRWNENYKDVIDILELNNGAVFENVYFENIYIDIDTSTVTNINSNIIHLNYRDSKINNVLFNGYINLKVNGISNGKITLPSQTCYVVDHLTVNNNLYASNNLISYETFNSDEFKTSNLKWTFTEKDIKNSNGLLYTIIDNSYIMINGYNGTNSTLDIPTTIDGLRVVGIEDLAFMDNKTIKKLIIPDSLLTIGASICSGCSNLESLVIDNTKIIKTKVLLEQIFGSREYGSAYVVSYYDYYYFRLKEYYVPNSLEELEIGSIETDERAFNLENIINLEKLTLKGDIIDIPTANGCINLKEVQLFNNIESIDAETFSSYRYLTMVGLPDSLTRIEDRTFCDRTKLVITNLPDSIISIGDYAFYECTNLALTNLPDSLTSIEDYAFYECTNLALTSLPDSLTSIGKRAFSGCTNLALTSLPDSLTSIGESAFSGCTNLALTSLPDSLTSIGNRAFDGCTNLALTSLPDSLTSIEYGTFSGCTNLALTSLPDSLTSIGDFAFFICRNLALTSLPDSLTSIGNRAFDGCTNLALTSLPDSLTSIGESAFHGCEKLSLTKLPDSLTSIGNDAFYDCNNIKSIILPNNIEYFDGEAFPSSLTVIIVPKTVNVINPDIFKNGRYYVFFESSEVPIGWDESYEPRIIPVWNTVVDDIIVYNDEQYVISGDKAYVIRFYYYGGKEPTEIEYNGKKYTVLFLYC